MITVPTSAIAQPDDAGQPVTPEVGDMVDLGAAQAEVTAVNGENVSLCIRSINGKAAQEDAPAGAEEDDVEQEGDDKPSADPSDLQSVSGNHKERARLMRKAAKFDKANGY